MYNLLCNKVIIKEKGERKKGYMEEGVRVSEEFWDSSEIYISSLSKYQQRHES